MKPEIMAEEPRYKRRKQANPRRKNVLNYEKSVETSSETDEDDGTFVPEDHVSVVRALEDDGWETLGDDDNNNTVRRQTDGKFFHKRDADVGERRSAAVAEYLQRSGTAVIYPEAPEEVRSQDESEHDDSAQLLACPFCHRGYKRLTSLKEHVKYRHDKNQIDCSQLQRHMTLEKPIREQVPSHSEDNGNRKFKCSECGKAFKYKHHLKEHLRIHSGEKPYECSNCKKRFSHSGSYSSHISSKKCVGLVAVNGRLRNGNGGKPGSAPCSPTSSPGRSALAQLRHKLKHGRLFGPSDHQGHLSLQHKHTDFTEYQLLMASQHGFGGPAVYIHSSSHSSSHSPLQDLEGMGLELPLLGYTGTLEKNLNEVQKVLQIVDNTVCQQKMDWNPEEVSRLRAYVKELGARIGDQKVALGGFNGNALEQEQEVKQEKPSRDENHRWIFSCQHCNQTFPGPIPLHQHERYLCNMNEDIRAVLPPGDGSTASSEPPEQTPRPNHCFRPNSEDLLKVSSSVGVPQECFSQWKSHNHQENGRKSTSRSPLMSLPDGDPHGRLALHRLDNNGHRRFSADDRAPEHLRRGSPSPLNLSSTSSKNSQSSFYTSEDAQRETPLDLSLPKNPEPRANGCILEYSAADPGSAPTDPMMNIKTEVLGSDGRASSLQQLDESSGPVFGLNPFTGGSVYASLPPHGAFPPPSFMCPAQATVPGLRPFPGLDPMSFLPQMTFTYSTGAATFADLQQHRKYQKKPGFQCELLDGAARAAEVDFLSGLDELTDRKKMRKTESGTYACDVCDKTFQKTSSLLRHKYEHTGKRPHQCQICKKAFKHKHHLIEHSRLHSGEKPYQCDKCGKRFSHSGSYSQHMNHRYSYCKREAEERQQEQQEEQEQQQDKGGGADVETSELLRRTAYLQELVTLRYSDPDVTLRDSREEEEGGGGGGGGGGGQEDTGGDKMFEEVTERPETSLRKGDEEDDVDEGNSRSQKDS